MLKLVTTIATCRGTGIAQDYLLYIFNQVAAIYVHELASVEVDGKNSVLRALPIKPLEYIPVGGLALPHPI